MINVTLSGLLTFGTNENLSNIRHITSLINHEYSLRNQSNNVQSQRQRDLI